MRYDCKTIGETIEHDLSWPLMHTLRTERDTPRLYCVTEKPQRLIEMLHEYGGEDEGFKCDWCGQREYKVEGDFCTARIESNEKSVKRP